MSKKLIAGIIASVIAVTGTIGGLIAWVIHLRKKCRFLEDNFHEYSEIVDEYIELTDKKCEIMQDEINLYSETFKDLEELLCEYIDNEFNVEEEE